MKGFNNIKCCQVDVSRGIAITITKESDILEDSCIADYVECLSDFNDQTITLQGIKAKVAPKRKKNVCVLNSEEGIVVFCAKSDDMKLRAKEALTKLIDDELIESTDDNCIASKDELMESFEKEWKETFRI